MDLLPTDAMQRLCDEISDLVMDIRALRAHAQLDHYAAAVAFMPTVPPVIVYVPETDEERAMREAGERLLAEAESDARWLADREADLAANACTITRAELAAEYAAHVERQYLAAEDYCRGVLLSRTAEAAGVHPRTLFSGPSHVAYARASEELRRYWADVEPRMTKAEFAAHVTGHWTDAAETARHAAYNAWRAA